MYLKRYHGPDCEGSLYYTAGVVLLRQNAFVFGFAETGI